ncbi:MAG: hypothetical protein IT371_31160 [Deltaproteobacteria bacterium]|nr:hypothetical protein [Deltaproteobacteria bacterium]
MRRIAPRLVLLMGAGMVLPAWARAPGSHTEGHAAGEHHAATDRLPSATERLPAWRRYDLYRQRPSPPLGALCVPPLEAQGPGDAERFAAAHREVGGACTAYLDTYQALGRLRTESWSPRRMLRARRLSKSLADQTQTLARCLRRTNEAIRPALAATRADYALQLLLHQWFDRLGAHPRYVAPATVAGFDPSLVTLALTAEYAIGPRAADLDRVFAQRGNLTPGELIDWQELALRVLWHRASRAVHAAEAGKLDALRDLSPEGPHAVPNLGDVTADIARDGLDRYAPGPTTPFSDEAAAAGFGPANPFRTARFRPQFEAAEACLRAFEAGQPLAPHAVARRRDRLIARDASWAEHLRQVAGNR